MNSLEYMTLSRVSGEIGDKFYRCVSEWLHGAREKRAACSCRELGRQYSDALAEQLRYLNSLKPDPKRDAAIRACGSYRASLEKSLGLLDAPLKKGN